MKYIPIYLFCFFSLISCTKNLEIPLPVHEPKLTLYTFLTEGKPIDLYVSRSFGTLEKITIEDIQVKDAQVELYRNDQLIDQMRFADTTIVDTLGSYTYSPGPGQPDTTIYFTDVLQGAKYFPSKSLEFPKAGDQFRFIVSHPEYGTVEASTQIPEKADITRLILRKDSLTFQDIEGYEKVWSALDISIQDRIETSTYYNFLLAIDYEQVDILQDTTYTFPQREWIWPGREILRDPDAYTYVENSPLSDETFEGQTGSQLWWFTLPTFQEDNETTRWNLLSLRVRPLSMTRAYALFQQKLHLQTYNRLSGIESAFVPSEPVVIPSNVEGGYGMVGAFNEGEEIILDLR